MLHPENIKSIVRDLNQTMSLDEIAGDYFTFYLDDESNETGYTAEQCLSISRQANEMMKKKL